MYITRTLGEPIYCWYPAEFTDAMVDYTNNVCWVSNTYFVHFDDDIPKHDYMKRETEIGYYQWVPMILLFQVSLMYQRFLFFFFFFLLFYYIIRNPFYCIRESKQRRSPFYPR